MNPNNRYKNLQQRKRGAIFLKEVLMHDSRSSYWPSAPFALMHPAPPRPPLPPASSCFFLEDKRIAFLCRCFVMKVVIIWSHICTMIPRQCGLHPAPEKGCGFGGDGLGGMMDLSLCPAQSTGGGCFCSSSDEWK